MAERPGIMLYFDLAEPLKYLCYEDKGKLLDAMLDYGQYGVVPDFAGVLQMAWGFIRPKLDADAKSYRKKVVRNTYSSYCAKEKSADRTPMSFEEWLEREGIDADWNRTVPPDAERSPTTAPSTDTMSKGDTKTVIAGDGGGKGEEEPTPEEAFETLRRKQMAKLVGWQ